MRDVNYLALDLEYNCDGKGPVEDIIQVGLAVGSPVNGSIDTWSFLVKPQGKAVTLHPFITDLTGITQEQYDSEAVPWKTVVGAIEEIHNACAPFCNPVTWGMGDATDLITTVKAEGLQFPYFGRRILDVKHFFLFIEAAKGRSLSGGLRSAMGKHRLPFEGKPHRADVDAYNTLRFFFHLLKRQSSLESLLYSASQIKP